MPNQFTVPPAWPKPPAGWSPAPGWQPDPAWGPAPDGWDFWREDPYAPTADADPDPDAAKREGGDGEAVAELRTSARGWHGVQLAVIGFIGICGALQQGPADAPRWLQVTALMLVIAALICACVGIAAVATVAWPLSKGSGNLRQSGRLLREGVLLSFVAAALTALAATAGVVATGHVISAKRSRRRGPVNKPPTELGPR